MSTRLHQAQSHAILRSWQNGANDVNHHTDFVLPMFIVNDDDAVEAIDAMPGVNRYGCNKAIEYLEPLVRAHGLRAVLLFPVIGGIDITENGSKSALDIDDDDEDDEDEEIITSTASSSAPQSSSGSSNSSDDDGVGDRQTNVLPKRLIPRRAVLPEGHIPVRLLTSEDPTQSSPTNSQNPFLNQNEEEEDHLLGDTSDRVQGEGGPKNISSTLHPNLLKRLNLGMKPNALEVKRIKNLALTDENNPVLRLIPRLIEKFPELLVICDVCLCTFTSTGHCCLFNDIGKITSQAILEFNDKTNLNRILPENNGIFHNQRIANEATCQYLALLSVEYATRGCHVIAPSDMMDGRVGKIRKRLDDNRFNQVPILSYSAKFASAFYGPFRQAANSAPSFGDRKAYQLPPGSRNLAMRAIERDISEGASMVMVKPAGHYLDVVRDIRETHPFVPIAVYQVSGEYSMLQMAHKADIIDLKLAVNEMLTSFRRAGATLIITYFTPEILRGEL